MIHRRLAMLAVPLILAAPLAVRDAAAAAHPHPGGPVVVHRGHGRLIPILADGTLREPSTDHAEMTDDAAVDDSTVTHWDLSLAGGSVDRIGTLDTRSGELMHFGLSRGIGHGRALAVEFEPWDVTRVQQGPTAQPVQEQGVGQTTLGLRQRLFGAPGRLLGAAAALWVKAPGGSAAPTSSEVEAGASLPVSIYFGEDTRIDLVASGAWAANAASDGRHLDGAAAGGIKRDLWGGLSAWVEAGSVWSGEPLRPWLGVVDGGIGWDAIPHVDLALGASAGRGAGVDDRGLFGRIGLHR